VSTNKPIKLEAKIQILKETEELRKEVAAIVEFPKNKTPDMLFFSGCFVSSGENLNHAYFMPSEMVKAHSSIVNKPLDIEHSEEEIVGHIYSSVFVDHSGKVLDVSELSSMEEETLDKMDIDVMIGGIIYKSRFPELAEEVQKGKWKLSMETYFQDYDVKVGDLVLSRKEAEAMGLASSDILGKAARIVKKGAAIASGEIARVLRDLMFSGCGLVKQPANPRSLIFETAKKHEEEGTIVVELDKDDEIKIPVKKEESDIDIVDIRKQTSVGICVSYKKYVYASEPPGPDTEILHENWCTLFEAACTSFGHDVTDPNCLRRQAERKAAKYAKAKMQEVEENEKRGKLLSELKQVLQKN
jgi:hypothetical protein